MIMGKSGLTHRLAGPLFLSGIGHRLPWVWCHGVALDMVAGFPPNEQERSPQHGSCIFP